MTKLNRASILLVALVLSHTAHAGNTPPWFYRVFRGWKLASVPADRFPAVLAEKFIPAAPETHAKNGLVAYVPALPPQQKTTACPDEIAIVVYESEQVYNTARNTPEGQAYAAMHWDYFDKNATKSFSAKPMGRQIAEDQPVDVLGCGADWQKGHTVVFIGERLPAVARDAFLGELTEHVIKARDSFRPLGLDGYIVVATPDQEYAWMHWKTKEQYDKAMAGPDGAAVGKDAGRLMKTLMWAEAAPFKGKIEYGQAVNVQFERRKPAR